MAKKRSGVWICTTRSIAWLAYRTPNPTALVEQVIKAITDCLERGEKVKLPSFGSFVVRKKNQRTGRNPKTGQQVPMPPRQIMMFKPSAVMKQRINSADRQRRGATDP